MFVGGGKVLVVSYVGYVVFLCGVCLLSEILSSVRLSFLHDGMFWCMWQIEVFFPRKTTACEEKTACLPFAASPVVWLSYISCVGEALSMRLLSMYGARCAVLFSETA